MQLGCADDEMCLHHYNSFVIFVISDDGCHQPEHVADSAASSCNGTKIFTYAVSWY
jgi:hypothetical protein